MPEPIYRVHLREAASPSSGRAAGNWSEHCQRRPRAEKADVTADRTIDGQLANDRRSSGEETLLKNGA